MLTQKYEDFIFYITINEVNGWGLPVLQLEVHSEISP
mgnify:CR=1 FL=1